MRLILIILMYIIYKTSAESENSTEQNYLDLCDVNANEILWENLFIKLNALLSKNDMLSQSLLDMNKRLDAQDALIRQSFNQSQTWTTILRRQDDSISFYRGWNEYREGFGDPNGNFFIGLEKLHALTTYGSPQELLVVLKDHDDQTRYAKYSRFRIGSEEEKYPLKELGTYTGDAGDGLERHLGHKFTTNDQNNNIKNTDNCASVYQGAWWFQKPCYRSHLNGPYRKKEASSSAGVSWGPYRGWDYSLKYAEMMIRPTS